MSRFDPMDPPERNEIMKFRSFEIPNLIPSKLQIFMEQQ
jgi:hypothetical protein